MGFVARQLLLLAGLAGCTFDADYGDSMLRCSEQDPRCPSGTECQAGRCLAPPDAAPGDGGAGAPDAMLTYCELAAMAADNDGCAQAIEVTSGMTVYGDTSGYTDDFSCLGTPTVGPDAAYRVDVAAGQTLTATLTPWSWDGTVYIHSGCGSGTCLTISAENGTAIETATYMATATTTLYVIVDGGVVSYAGCYALRITVE